MEAIDKIRDTAISHHRLFFVEVMGADAGYIALNSGLAIGAQEILIPEVNMSFDNLINSLKKSKTAGKTSSIIVVAEGDKTGKNVFELVEKTPRVLCVPVHPLVVLQGPLPLLVLDRDADYLERVLVVCQVADHATPGGLVEGPPGPAERPDV